MSFFRRQYITVVVLVVVSLLFLLKIELRETARSDANIFTDVPLTIGEWTGRDVSVSQSVYDILETDNLLVREYENEDGDKVSIAVVYSADNRSAFHPPEICYIGGGVELLEKGTVSLPGVTDKEFFANKLVMRDRGGVIKAWYWFSTSSAFTHNYYLQQWNILVNGLIRNRHDGALIRVSSRGADTDEKAVFRFIRDVLPVLEKFLQKT